MRTLSMTMALLLTGALGAAAAIRDRGGETASATSLLTAERRAREAADRLRVPHERPSGWRPGGEGWTPAWRPALPEPRPRR